MFKGLLNSFIRTLFYKTHCASNAKYHLNYF